MISPYGDDDDDDEAADGSAPAAGIAIPYGGDGDDGTTIPPSTTSPANNFSSNVTVVDGNAVDEATTPSALKDAQVAAEAAARLKERVAKVDTAEVKLTAVKTKLGATSKKYKKANQEAKKAEAEAKKAKEEASALVSKLETANIALAETNRVLVLALEPPPPTPIVPSASDDFLACTCQKVLNQCAIWIVIITVVGLLSAILKENDTRINLNRNNP